MLGMTRTATRRRKLVASMLALTISGYWVPAGTFAASTAVQQAEISGNILASDGLTGVAGVTVKAANVATSEIYTSSRTAADGSYLLTGLPAGSYDLAVETTQGMFAADNLVAAQLGHRTLASLALRPDAQEGKDKPPAEAPQTPPAAEGKKDDGKKTGDTKEPTPEQSKKKKGGGFWRSKTGAAILIGGGAVLIGVIAANSSNDSNNNDKPMTPGTTNVPK